MNGPGAAGMAAPFTEAFPVCPVCGLALDLCTCFFDDDDDDVDRDGPLRSHAFQAGPVVEGIAHSSAGRAAIAR